MEFRVRRLWTYDFRFGILGFRGWHLPFPGPFAGLSSFLNLNLEQATAAGMSLLRVAQSIPGYGTCLQKIEGA